jgi:hypothetical protein
LRFVDLPFLILPGMRWVGVDGFEVELVVLDRLPILRISQRVGRTRYWHADCRTPAEVAEHVDLADLVEVIPIRPLL